MTILSKNRLQALQNISLVQSNHILFRSWAALYHSRFPYQELAPITSISQSLNCGENAINGIFDTVNQQWAGFTLIEYYGESTLLAYLATAPSFEGLGLARDMVEQSLQTNLTKEKPYYWLEANPKLWKFYKKLGFKRLDMEYRIPEFYAEGTEKMGLFVKTHSSISHIEKKVVESFVSKLLLDGYQITNKDPRYQQQMRVIEQLSQDTISTL